VRPCRRITASIAARSGGAARRSLDDRRHIAEVLGAEDAGADDRQHPCVDVALVLELVDEAAPDAEYLAGSDLCFSPSIVQVSTPSSP